MPAYTICKRVVDVVCSLVMALILLPALMIIALHLIPGGRVRLCGVAYIGQHGRGFVAYQFRAQAPRGADASTGDTRRKTAWILSQSGIGDLPRLWSVLRGDMSLAGPRLMTRDELRANENAAFYYEQVKPGLSGLPEGAAAAGSRAQALRHYALHASLAYDLALLGGAAKSVLGQTLGGKPPHEG